MIDKDKWLLGLAEGWPKIVANMSAVAVICIMFWNAQNQFYEAYREQTSANREELKEFRKQLEMQRNHDRDMRQIYILQVENLAATQRQANEIFEKSQQDLRTTLKAIQEILKKGVS